MLNKVFKTKSDFNLETQKYSDLLARLKNLIDETDKDSFDFTNIYTEPIKINNDFTIIKTSGGLGLVKKSIDIDGYLEIVNSEAKTKWRFPRFFDKIYYVVDDLLQRVREVKNKAANGSLTREDIEVLKQLKAEQKAALTKIYQKVDKQKTHLHKARSLYNLLIDLRKDLRRVVRKAIKPCLDDEDEAYLIKADYTIDRVIYRLSMLNFKSSKHEKEYIRCY